MSVHTKHFFIRCTRATNFEVRVSSLKFMGAQGLPEIFLRAQPWTLTLYYLPTYTCRQMQIPGQLGSRSLMRCWLHHADSTLHPSRVIPYKWPKSCVILLCTMGEWLLRSEQKILFTSQLNNYSAKSTIHLSGIYLCFIVLVKAACSWVFTSNSIYTLYTLLYFLV